MTLDAAHPDTAASPPVPAFAGGRVRRAAMTWFAGALYTIATLLIGLIATPLIVRFLGEARFGAFRALSDWVGYLTLADLGLGSAFGVLLLRARVAGTQQTASVLRYSLRVLTRFTLLAIPLGLVLAWFMPHLIAGGQQFAVELRVATAIGVIGLAMGPLLVFRSYLETAQRGYLVHAALLVQSIIITVLAVVLAWRGWGLIGQSIATVIGAAVFSLLLLRWGMPSLRRGGTTAATTSPVRPRELWSLAWPLATAGAGNRLNLMTDTIVVGKMLGSVEVAVLFLTQRVIRLASAQVNALANASWAGLAELRESGQLRLFESRLAEISRLIVGVGTVVVGAVAAYTHHFVRLWVGADLYGGDLLCAATVASTVVFGFFLPYAWAIDMAGDTRHRLWVSMTGSVLNLALSILFIRWIGLAGVALGTLAAYLLTDAWYCPYLACRRYEIRARVILAAAGRGLLVGLPWAAAAWLLARVHTPPMRWLGLIGEGTLIAAASAFYCWYVVLTQKERHEWLSRFNRARA